MQPPAFFGGKRESRADSAVERELFDDVEGHGFAGKVVERLGSELRDDIGPRAIDVARGSDLWRRRDLDELVMDGQRAIPRGHVGHIDLQVGLGLEPGHVELDVSHLVRRHVLAHQVLEEPGKDGRTRLLVIRVTAGRLDEPEIVRPTQCFVELLELGVHLADRFDRKDPVLVGRGDEERARRDERPDVREIPESPC